MGTVMLVRASALVALLVLALALPFVGVGAVLAVALGFVFAILVLGFVADAARAFQSSPCKSAAADARRARWSHAVGAFVMGALGVAGVGAMLLARPRRQVHGALPPDPRFPT